MKKFFTSLLLLAGCTTLLSAQNRPADSVRRTAFPTGFAGNVTKAAPKPYKTVITEKAITRRGLFKTHKVEDKYYFEIGDSVLNREILVVSRISKAGAEVRAASGYAGDQIGSSVISLKKGRATVFLCGRFRTVLTARIVPNLCTNRCSVLTSRPLLPLSISLLIRRTKKGA